MGCFSILSDVTTLQDRSFRMTILESAYVITGGVTNLAIGYLINDTGFLLPYAFTGVVQVINIIVIIFFIPEVVSKTKRRAKEIYFLCSLQASSSASERRSCSGYDILTKKQKNFKRQFFIYYLSCRVL